jgi:hypothetical protein
MNSMNWNLCMKINFYHSGIGEKHVNKCFTLMLDNVAKLLQHWGYCLLECDTPERTWSKYLLLWEHQIMNIIVLIFQFSLTVLQTFAQIPHHLSSITTVDHQHHFHFCCFEEGLLINKFSFESSYAVLWFDWSCKCNTV